uniref:Ubiquitin-like domain-containing protein n=3 Tax=Eukaryota TaxID=2759 RepID=A0A6T5ZNR3_DIALT|mmetsp:Transcript_16215/g.50508  ORF Transcript_16215/g.50508 Transcript_16215/m.50508 type:complete len:128 (+) Transcript_16215:65-448(+)
MKLTVQPRVQKEKWSLYWRTSMNTKTELLDPFVMDVTPTMKCADVKAKIAERFMWEPVSQLLRLEGFEENWELMVFEGRECADDSTLEDCGIEDGNTVTTVRKVLVAEGWKIGGNGDDDSDTDEDDF